MHNPHFEIILKQSLHEKKSVGIYLNGHVLAGVVYQLTETTVFLRNREYAQIVIGLNQILAIVMH
ncbi:MAG: hypothetical protein EAZ57_07180 [Cytophagales bacterium]|nr:MAG: hypothetical protein EAZ67_07990 [Cytophagales bacterium]TAF60484.1 MAG: hypothetical protein EAZ57_07180 [Cytophagales bacterium]